MAIQLERENLQLLFCECCPNDCQGLTREEKLGCVASGAFVDEYYSSKAGLALVREGKAEMVRWIIEHNQNAPLSSTRDWLVSYADQRELWKQGLLPESSQDHMFSSGRGVDGAGPVSDEKKVD